MDATLVVVVAGGMLPLCLHRPAALLPGTSQLTLTSSPTVPAGGRAAHRAVCQRPHLLCATALRVSEGQTLCGAHHLPGWLVCCLGTALLAGWIPGWCACALEGSNLEGNGGKPLWCTQLQCSPHSWSFLLLPPPLPPPTHTPTHPPPPALCSTAAAPASGIACARRCCGWTPQSTMGKMEVGLTVASFLFFALTIASQCCGLT